MLFVVRAWSHIFMLVQSCTCHFHSDLAAFILAVGVVAPGFTVPQIHVILAMWHWYNGASIPSTHPQDLVECGRRGSAGLSNHAQL